MDNGPKTFLMPPPLSPQIQSRVPHIMRNTMPPIMLSADLIPYFTAMDNPEFNAADFDAPKSDSEGNIDGLKLNTVFVR